MIDRIERGVELAVSVGRVWDALTEPELLADWLAEVISLELRPGGDACFVVDGRVRSGWIEDVSPPGHDDGREATGGRLIFWWAEGGEPASRVEFVLSPTDRGTTRLQIVETRPLEVLDLVGVPFSGPGGGHHGPVLVAA